MILIVIIFVVGLNILFILKFNIIDRFLMQEQIIEINWTILPIFILLLIALPSLKILYLLDDPFEPDISVKAIGHQWYWSYEYSDFMNVEFDSYIINENFNEIPRLLNTDNSLILPVLRKIRVNVTADDVIHSWTVPVLGVKVDAVPGRINQLIFSITRTGIYFGQCSEICGANHRFIPIKLECVPIINFISWIKRVV